MIKNARWTAEEDLQLIDELSTNNDISNIASKHGRTILCIDFRRRVIAYNMYKNNIQMEVIQNKTKLDIASIHETIQRRNRQKWNTKPTPHTSCVHSYRNTDMKSIKEDIGILKSNVQEIMEMMNAIYEFEYS